MSCVASLPALLHPPKGTVSLRTVSLSICPDFSSPRNESVLSTRIPRLNVSADGFFFRKPGREKKGKYFGTESTNGFALHPDFDGESSEGEFVVVNFYHFVHIKDPEEEVKKHSSFLQGLDIHGRIYMSKQGINAQYSGPSKDALAYMNWLKEDIRFSDIFVQISSAVNGHAFPRLKLRYRSSLVQLEGGISHLPLVDPSMRAISLSPSEWKRKLLASVKHDEASSKHHSCERDFLLLDVRNGYEWDIGHFIGADRPDVDCFRSTSFGLSNSKEVDSDPLAYIDKDRTDVLMYCTGGIRCDVYSAFLRQRGFQNLYTLQGGISNYLECQGPIEWVGNLFVFDSRLSLPPSAHKMEIAGERQEQLSRTSDFARCYICGSAMHELRHRNCANLDCNLLFLSCANCLEEFRGCCCLACKSAPRIRPLLPGHQRYQKWHVYRDAEVQRKPLV